MKKTITTLIVLCMTAIGLMLAGCGGSSSSPGVASVAPGTTPDGATLYGAYCASCHGALASSDKAGATANQTQAAISNNTGGMGTLNNLTPAQIQAIADALAQPAPALPAAPTGVTATGGTSQVTLSWSAVSGASSYNVYWSTNAGVTKANGTKIDGATSPTVLTGLADGTTCYCIVTAVNSAGESAPSVQVAATTLTPDPTPTIPSAPTGVTATGGTSQVTLSWQTLSGADSYNVYWGTSSGITTATGTKIAGVTSPYVQTGLAAGTTYYYIVTAVNSAGEGAASSQASATTAQAPAPTPMAGQAVYDNNCAACHRLGTYDAAGSAPNLSGLGAKVDGKFTAGVAGHMGKTLTATQITDLKAFLNAN